MSRFRLPVWVAVALIAGGAWVLSTIAPAFRAIMGVNSDKAMKVLGLAVQLLGVATAVAMIVAGFLYSLERNSRPE